MLDLEDLHSIICIISFLLRIVNEQDDIFFPKRALLPSVIDCNDGRSIINHFFQIYSILSIIVDKESRNA